jgi:hypothetical protein
MKKIFIVIGGLAIFLSLTTSAYSKKEEECTCANQNTSLSEAIKSDMTDVFDTQTGFAASGLSFVDNLPENLGGAGALGSPDITLTEETSAPGKKGQFIKLGGKKHHAGCRNCELISLEEIITELPSDLP